MLTAASNTDVAAQSLLKNSVPLRNVVIPYKGVVKVLIKNSLHRFVIVALKPYASLDKLEPDVVGAFISMIYNRGFCL